jgi:hypothetical protein
MLAIIAKGKIIGNDGLRKEGGRLHACYQVAPLDSFDRLMKAIYHITLTADQPRAVWCLQDMDELDDEVLDVLRLAA